MAATAGYAISVPQQSLKPQSYSSDGTDAIGFLQFWGASPALDLVGEDPQALSFGPCAVGVQPGMTAPVNDEAAKAAAADALDAEAPIDAYEEAAPSGSSLLVEPELAPLPAQGDGAVNVLIVGGADARHVLRTVARRHIAAPGQKLRFYLHDKHHETLARHLLFLQIVNNTDIPVRERAEIFLSLYGNTLVRDKDEKYLSDTVDEFVEFITDNSEHPLAKVVDLTHLKYRERDALQDIVKGWKLDVPFDIESLRDQRCRGYYRTRYDYRKNLMDWDYQSYIKQVAGIIHWLHYKEFCHTGVAFETRLASYSRPNRSLASYTEGRDQKKGTSIQVRGFWGDIINSPYHGFGTTAHSIDKARLFKISGSQYRQHETDVAEFNVIGVISEMETGEAHHLPPERPEEHEFPYASPLDGLRGVDLPPQVEEVVVPEKLAPAPEAAEDSKASRGRREKGSFSRTAKKAPVKHPHLVPAFENVEVVLLSGELSEVLKKSRYSRHFHRVFVGSLAVMPLLEELGLHGGGDPGASSSSEPRRIRRAPRLEMPEDFGQRRDVCSLAGAMADGALAIFETMKYQAHFDGNVKLGFRHRIAQAGHLAGLHLLDERRSLPSLEHDMKESRARDLEKYATDFLRFVNA